jgi:hypothetical protein
VPLSPADLNDIDFFDAPELRADGTLATPYRTITGLVSITAVTSRIVVPATELLTLNRDLPVEVGDRVVISGASGGNGTYKIVAIVDEQRFDVTPAPSANGVGGSAAFYYPAGATKIGIDPTGRSNFTGNTLQDALTQIDVAISASGVSSYDFLLENEPPAPSTTYTTTFTGNFITQERWRRLDTTLIRTIDYTYSSGRVVTEVRKVYAADGTTIDAQLTIAYTYTGNVVSSATRTRNI